MLSREAPTWTSVNNTRLNIKSLDGKYILPSPLPSVFKLKTKGNNSSEPANGKQQHKKSRIVQIEPLIKQNQPIIIQTKSGRSSTEKQMLLQEKQQVPNSLLHASSVPSLNQSENQPSLPPLPGKDLKDNKSNTDAIKFKKAKDHWRETLRNARAKEDQLEKELEKMKRANEEKDKLLEKINLSTVGDKGTDLQQMVLNLQKQLKEKDQTIESLKEKEHQQEEILKDIVNESNMLKSENLDLHKENCKLKEEKEEMKSFLEENINMFMKDKEAILREVSGMTDELEKEIDDHLEHNRLQKKKVNELEKIIQNEKNKRRSEKENHEAILKGNHATIGSLEKEVRYLNKNCEDLKMRLKREMEINIGRFNDSLKTGRSNGDLVCENNKTVVNAENRIAQNGKSAPNDEKQSGRRSFDNNDKDDESGFKPDESS